MVALVRRVYRSQTRARGSRENYICSASAGRGTEREREREREGGGKEPELKRGIATDGSAFANSITRIDERAEPSGD